MKASNNNNFFIAIIIAVTISLVALFLSGSIIEIPLGTKEGGVICVIGIGIILIAVFAIISVRHWLLNRKKA